MPAWTLAVTAVALGSLASLAAWALLAPQAAALPVRVALVLAAAVVVALAWSLARVAPAVLRWDGAGWRLMPTPSAGPSVDVLGRIGVAIDLGSFLLVRFVAAPRRPGSVRWLPVSRRGQEAQWHAFRCALYAPSPGEGRDAAGYRQDAG